jgi:large subunit ribosomal protein L9
VNSPYGEFICGSKKPEQTDMKVLLTQDIDKVGKRGEIKNVANGYARNFLFPKKLAVTPTPQNIKQLSIEARRRAQQETELRKGMEDVAAKLKQTSSTISVRADENGHLYGSVTEGMIALALKEEGVEIETRTIVLPAPIKELGVYDVEIRLHPEVVVPTRVWVVEETAKRPPEEKEAKESEDTAD